MDKKRNNNVVINFGDKYTFGEMIDKLSKDSTMSFISDGRIYFKRKDKLLSTIFNDNTIFDVVHAVPIILNNKITSKIFYSTNIYISNIIYEINIGEVKEKILEGKTIMLLLNNRTWIITLEDNVVFLDYSEADDANEDNYKELFADDVLTSLIEGQWYVIDGEENDIITYNTK